MAVEPIFLDTNILLAATDSGRQEHANCHALLEAGLQGKQSLFISGQVIREYLVVATRPSEVNGFGMTTDQALNNVAQMKQCLHVLDETTQVATRLTQLIAQYQLTGKRIHDANIVATMLENGITQLETLNPDDFKCFEALSMVSR